MTLQQRHQKVIYLLSKQEYMVELAAPVMDMHLVVQQTQLHIQLLLTVLNTQMIQQQHHQKVL